MHLALTLNSCKLGGLKTFFSLIMHLNFLSLSHCEYEEANFHVKIIHWVNLMSIYANIKLRANAIRTTNVAILISIRFSEFLIKVNEKREAFVFECVCVCVAQSIIVIRLVPWKIFAMMKIYGSEKKSFTLISHIAFIEE